MKKIFLSLFFFLSLVQFSFSQNSPIIKYLPKNSSLIMSFNPVSLASKIPGEDFRQSFFYKKIMKEKDGVINIFFSDPSATGIDFSKGLIFANVKDTTSNYPTPVYHIFGAIKDEPLFAHSVKKLIQTDDTIKVYGTNKMVFSKKTDPILAWNNEVFVLTYGNSIKKLLSSDASLSHDSTLSDTTISLTGNNDPEYYEKKKEQEEENFRIEQRNYCFELLTPKNNNPFLQNTYLSDLMKLAGDIRIWANGTNFGLGRYLGIMPPQTKGMFSSLQSIFGKNKTTVINFENGKMTFDTRSFPEGKMASVYQKNPSQRLQTDLALRLPKKEILGLMINSVNKGFAKEIVEASGLNKVIDSIKNKIPFDLSLAQSAFKNNVLLAVLKNEKDTNNKVEDKPSGIDLILALPIADKQKFEELKSSVKATLDSLKESKSETKNETKFFNNLKPYVQYNDTLFVLSLSEKTASDFLNNSTVTPAPEWLQTFSSFPMVTELNMKEIINFAFTSKNKVANEKNQEIAKKLNTIFDKMIIAGGKFEHGHVNGTTEFRFGNKNENALKQIFDLFDLAAQQDELKKNNHLKD